MTPNERVQKGIAFLNLHAPDWRSRINKEKLTLRLWSSCILGQVFGMMNLDKQFKLIDDLANYGFTVYSAEEDVIMAAEWKKVI